MDDLYKRLDDEGEESESESNRDSSGGKVTTVMTTMQNYSSQMDNHEGAAQPNVRGLKVDAVEDSCKSSCERISKSTC